MVKRNNKKTHYIGFKEFEVRCKSIAKELLSNKNIKNIYGVPRGGIIMATRISYLTGIPITGAPNGNHTAILDDCLDSGATRHSFENFPFFFVLVDKQFEEIKDWLIFWWEDDQKNPD